jgi:hypothetical protein
VVTLRAPFQTAAWCFREDAMKRICVAIACALLMAMGTTGSAQQAPSTVRLRGTIEKLEGNVVSMKLSDGSSSTLTLANDALIVGVVKAAMAEIREGVFFGSAAMPQPDGTQKALEVHIFPEQMRGQGEGHRPFTTPGSTMTNGTASGSTVASVDGSTILVKYKEGEKKIVVPPDVPITRYEIGSRVDLKPGAAFTVTAATRKPDGTYESGRINVGRDGVVPQ